MRLNPYEATDLDHIEEKSQHPKKPLLPRLFVELFVVVVIVFGIVSTLAALLPEEWK